MSANAPAESLKVAPRYTGRQVVGWLLAAIVLTLVIGFNVRQAVRVEPKPMPVLATVPNVTLTEANGSSLQLRAFQGKTLFIDLQPLGCAIPCEERNLQMQEIQYWNEAVADKVLHVTIIEGPVPTEKLKELAKKYRSKRNWRWFTIDSTEFSSLKNVLQPDATSDLYLVDGQFQLRRRILTTKKDDRRELMLDSRAILLEAERRRGT
ncbi:MAG: hypothetical protein ACKO6N_13845 [Myxococcota bacterium]